MQLLVLGQSSIVRRRVLPAARRAFDRVSVASRRAADAGLQVDAWFTDYERGLAASGADVVYVSGTNDVHAGWTRRAIEHGLHVIVDKPAFLDHRTAEELVALARARRVGLAEATVFPFHPQFARLQSMVPRTTVAQTRVVVSFCVPPLPAGDFRYRRDSGGGALYDLGPYVAAVYRLLLGDQPSAAHCTVQSRGEAVDTSFSFLLGQAAGGALVGHCGFVTAYQNRLTVLTPEHAVHVDRLFSPPPDHTGLLVIRHNEQERTVAIPPADSFELFFKAFIDAAAAAQFAPFHDALLQDAALLAQLRASAGVS